jgi:hypothetical protein
VPVPSPYIGNFFSSSGLLLISLCDVDEDARPLAAKYLVKWRPGFVESQTQAQASGSGAPPANNMAIAT